MDAHDIQTMIDEYKLTVNVIQGEPIPSGDNIVFAYTQNPVIGHWVAVQRRGGRTLLVDSYGLPNKIAYTIPFLPSNTVWSNVTGQRLGTMYCGLYALAFYVLTQKHDANLSEALDALYPRTDRGRDNADSLHHILGTHPDLILAQFNIEDIDSTIHL
jgi:hypothetical protein